MNHKSIHMKKLAFFLMALAVPLLFACNPDKPDEPAGNGENTENPGNPENNDGGEVVADLPDKSAELGISALNLGLSVEWADRNIGASEPEASGYFFAWGEIEPKESYGWNSYRWGSSKTTLTKYETEKAEDKVLTMHDDVAHTMLGGKWRMPTAAEWQELRDKCTWEWTQLNRVNGIQGKTPEGAVIFFPAAGGIEGSTYHDQTKYGFYWTSTRVNEDASSAWSFYFWSRTLHYMDFPRHYGMTVRAVRDKK